MKLIRAHRFFRLGFWCGNTPRRFLLRQGFGGTSRPPLSRGERIFPRALLNEVPSREGCPTGGVCWFSLSTLSSQLSTPWFCLSVLVFVFALGSSLARAESWPSVVTGRSLELTLLEPDSTRGTAPLPVVFYLKNLASKTAGTVSDDVLLPELRASGHLVVLIDYAGDPKARVPWLNRDLGKLRDDVRAKKILASRNVDQAHVFIVPAGSRLVRDVVFYRDGARTLAMDIIAPAQPAKPVGTIIEFSCDNKDRMSNTSLSICSDTLLDAEATEGFAVAMADHPVAAPYKGLDAMPDSAWKIKAAVRVLRAQSEKLGLNGRVVPVGFSRGSGMALLLATTDGLTEFEGHGEPTTAVTSSAVQGAVVLSGRFTYIDLLANDHMLPRYAQAWGERETHLETWRNHGAVDYLKQPTVPLFLSINISESPDALYQMRVLRQRLAELGSDEIFQMDREPRGHKVPLDPLILGAVNEYLKRRLNE
jgi:hypothetical protein